MEPVGHWTDHEARALRRALRHSVRGFADYLGIATRTVAYWEAGGHSPRPQMQSILDTTFERASAEAKERFRAILREGQQGEWIEQFHADTVSVDRGSPRLGLTAGTDSDRPADAQALSMLPSTSWAAPICAAVMDPAGVARRTALRFEPESVGSLDIGSLKRMTEEATQASLASRHDQLARSLPSLIGYVELASLAASEGDQAAILSLLSDVHAVAGWSLIKADSPSTAWFAAQRAISAAEHAGDILRVAAGTRCLSEVHMRAGHLEVAGRTAFVASVHLDSSQGWDEPSVVCLRGAALLSAAAAAARRGDEREVHAALKAASICGFRLGEDRSDLGTVFGPTNVAIHGVAVAIELGDVQGALRRIPDVDLRRLPASLAERRARFLIDVARAHGGVRDDSTALQALIEAENESPAEVRTHRLTHGLLHDLLSRERRSSGLRALANRCRLPF